MSKLAKEFVTGLMSELRPKLQKAWPSDPELYKMASADFDFAEKTLLKIAEPLLNRNFEEVCVLTDKHAEELGAIGYSFLIDSIANLKSNKIQRAIKQYRASLLYAAGRAFSSAHNYTEASNRYKKAHYHAIKQKQYDLAANISIDIGILAAEDSNYLKALYWYKKAGQEARHANAHLLESAAIHNIATLKMESNPELAYKLFTQAIDLKKAHGAPDIYIASTYSNLGIISVTNGDYLKALGFFQKALKIYEDHNDLINLPMGLVNLANCMSELNRFKDAIPMYRKGIRIANKTNNIETLCQLHQGFAVNAINNAKYSIATQEFQLLHDILKLLNNDHDASVALHDLALSMARSGQKADARNTINKALRYFKLKNNTDWIRKCLFLIYAEIEKPQSKSGLAVLREAAHIKGGKDKDLKLLILETLWNELLDKGNYSEASQVLISEKRILRTMPLQLQNRLHRASMTLTEKERYKEALKLMRQANKLPLTIDSASKAFIRLDFANILAYNNRFSEASDLLSKNIKYAKERQDRALLATNLGNLGEIYRRSKKYQNAISCLTEAIELCKKLNDKEDLIAWLNNLALAYSESNKHQKAKDTISEALTLAKETSNEEGLARTYGTLGIFSAENTSYTDAIRHYSSSIKLAEKSELDNFALSMRYNRMIALALNNERKKAIKEAKIIIKNTHTQGLYSLAEEASESAAKWAIKWKYTAKAGELTAVYFLCYLTAEKHRLENVATLLLQAFFHFSDKQYKQFLNAIKRQLYYSTKSEKPYSAILQLEKEMRNQLKQSNEMRP